MFNIRVFDSPECQVLDEIIEIQNRAFDEPYSRAQVLDRVVRKRGFLSIHAYLDSHIVGFKAGYEKEPGIFYSWVGGVDPNYRKRGIAKTLMQEQHNHLVKLGYHRVETKTQNKFREMMIANLKSGFNIAETFVDADRGLQIVFQKSIG